MAPTPYKQVTPIYGPVGTDGKVACPICKRRWMPQGITNHVKFCMLNGPEEDDGDQSSFMVDTSVSSIQSDLPWEKSELLEDSILSNLENNNVPRDSRHQPLATESICVETPPKVFLPQPDSIKTEYHPHSDRKVKIKEQLFKEYCEYKNQPERKYNERPWLPFQSKSDFEFAEVAQDAHLNNGHIDRLLAIFQRCFAGEDKLHLRTSNQLNDAWKEASKLLPAFERHKLHVEHEDLAEEFEIHRRSLWDWASSLLDDPAIAKEFEWDARRIFKHDGNRYERFIHEPWTADYWWDIQSKLPPGAVPLCFVIYADKTKLSSFGSKKGYPVFARIANLPKDLRNGRGYTGGRLVGWLPVIEEDPEFTGKTDYVNFKRVVWHSSFLKFLESIQQFSWNGCWKKCADREAPRHIFPLIFVLSADYEEQSVMALTRGSNAKKPCPICLVPHDKLHDVHVCYELRSMEQTRNVINRAKELAVTSLTAAQSLLQEYGLKDVENAFWGIRFSDPHKILAFDHMHNHPHGLGGKHLWTELKKRILSVGKSASKQVQECGAAFPRWRGLHHFNEIMGESFNDAMKLDDVVKVSPFLSHSILDVSKSPVGYLLLRLVRSYLIFDAYLTFEVHTESTIEAGRRELKNYGTLMKDYIKAAAQEKDSKSWDFVKNHLHVHAFDDIQSKGVLSLYNTVYNEPLHGALKDTYNLRTNGKNADGQILRVDHKTYVAQCIRFAINNAEEIENEKSEDPDALEASSAKHDFGNVKLGTPAKQTTVRELVSSVSGKARFSEFRDKLLSFLKEMLRNSDASLHSSMLTVHNHTKITPFGFLKVSYESSVTWTTCTDYLRCNDKLKSPRHDCAMVQTNHGIIFVKLIFVFTIQIAETNYPLALVEPYDFQQPEGKLLQNKDADMQFLRLRTTGKTKFIHIKSIIRGAVLVPAYDIGTDYIVFDLLDSDMVLRIRKLLQLLDAAE